MNELLKTGQLMEGARFTRVVYASPAVSSVYEKVYELDRMGAAAIAHGFPEDEWPDMRMHELGHMKADDPRLPAQVVVAQRQNRGGGWSFMYRTIEGRTAERALAICLGPEQGLSFTDCTGGITNARSMGRTGEVYVDALQAALDNPGQLYSVPHPLKSSLIIELSYEY